jgi:hypothetical protein
MDTGFVSDTKAVTNCNQLKTFRKGRRLPPRRVNKGGVIYPMKEFEKVTTEDIVARVDDCLILSLFLFVLVPLFLLYFGII